MSPLLRFERGVGQPGTTNGPDRLTAIGRQTEEVCNIPRSFGAWASGMIAGTARHLPWARSSRKTAGAGDCATLGKYQARETGQHLVAPRYTVTFSTVVGTFATFAKAEAYCKQSVCSRKCKRALSAVVLQPGPQ